MDEKKSPIYVFDSGLGSSPPSSLDLDKLEVITVKVVSSNNAYYDSSSYSRDDHHHEDIPWWDVLGQWTAAQVGD
jgi:hypothetical protein